MKFTGDNFKYDKTYTKIILRGYGYTKLAKELGVTKAFIHQWASEGSSVPKRFKKRILKKFKAFNLEKFKKPLTN